MLGVGLSVWIGALSVWIAMRQCRVALLVSVPTEINTNVAGGPPYHPEGVPLRLRSGQANKPVLLGRGFRVHIPR